MLNVISLLVIPSLVFAPNMEEKATKIDKNSFENSYVIVGTMRKESNKKPTPYVQNRDKNSENKHIKTLEEQSWGEEREKLPYAKEGDFIPSSGEEAPSLESIIEGIDLQFEYMHSLKAKLDEREKENAKDWAKYYAIKEVYDRAINKCIEEWSKDNGIELSRGNKHALWR